MIIIIDIYPHLQISESGFECEGERKREQDWDGRCGRGNGEPVGGVEWE